MGKSYPSLVTFFKAQHPDWNIKELNLDQALTVIKEFKEVLK